MRAGASDEGWIAFLNKEAQELSKLEPTLSRSVLRASLRDRLGEAFTFPLRTFVRALVTGERLVDDAALASTPRAASAALAAPTMARQPRLLELWPAGLERGAAALTGPLLVPCARMLGPGSVLTAAVVLEEPRQYRLSGPGLIGRLVDYSVEVAVER